jgi:hypothetical protein
MDFVIPFWSGTARQSRRPNKRLLSPGECWDARLGTRQPASRKVGRVSAVVPNALMRRSSRPTNLRRFY